MTKVWLAAFTFSIAGKWESDAVEEFGTDFYSSGNGSEASSKSIQESAELIPDWFYSFLKGKGDDAKVEVNGLEEIGNTFEELELPCIWPKYSGLYKKSIIHANKKHKKGEHINYTISIEDLDANLSKVYCNGKEVGYYPKKFDEHYVFSVFENLNNTIHEILFQKDGTIIPNKRIKKAEIHRLVHYRQMWAEIWGSPVDRIKRGDYPKYIVNDLQKHLDPTYNNEIKQLYKFTETGRAKALRYNKIVHLLACAEPDFEYQHYKSMYNREHDMEYLLPFIEIVDYFESVPFRCDFFPFS